MNITLSVFLWGIAMGAFLWFYSDGNVTLMVGYALSVFSYLVWSVGYAITGKIRGSVEE